MIEASENHMHSPPPALKIMRATRGFMAYIALLILLLCIHSFSSNIFFPLVSSLEDTFTQSESFTDDGVPILMSSGGKFILSFFSPGSSRNRYLGISYIFSRETVVWVANRHTPIPDQDGVLTLTSEGVLALFERNTSIWTTPTPKEPASSPSVQLLDSGNLVILDGAASSEPLWQSFDYPTDTLLPTQKLGFVVGGLEWNLTSWSSADDPSPGDYACRMEPRGLQEIYVLYKGSTSFRYGPWVGTKFSGIPRMVYYGAGIINFSFTSTKKRAYYSYDLADKAVSTKLFMNHATGRTERARWDFNTRKWILFWSGPSGDCDKYALCGPNGVCDSESDMNVCRCYEGYRPKDVSGWRSRDFSLGCEREELDCSDVGFLKVQGVKLPDATDATVDGEIGHDECEDLCRKKCSCSAYSTADISTGKGCIMWRGNLIDTRKLAADGQDLYLKVPSSLIDKTSSKMIIVAVVASVVGLILIACGAYFIYRRQHRNNQVKCRLVDVKGIPREFRYNEIVLATENFSAENLIGEGAHSFVFKGNMGDRPVAVKKLKDTSLQGLDQIRNEVQVIAELHHKHLVRLVGWCEEDSTIFLIYDYMKNGSLLDAIIVGRHTLEWKARKNIIIGVADGLHYLHYGVVKNIIHRDLKCANILLDERMNPRITDFGTARMYDHDDSNDSRTVVGTPGYIAPELFVNGTFSVKSDVFSFGVVMLEIISGTTNALDGGSLLQQAWQLRRDGRAFVDWKITEDLRESEVLRYIQIGLLCVQYEAESRPDMKKVTAWLTDEADTSALVEPTGPGDGRVPATGNQDPTPSTGTQPSHEEGQVSLTVGSGR